MNTFKGKICATHPELQGERNARGSCALCVKAQDAARYLAHKEIRTAQSQAWRNANPDRHAENNKRWSDANKERIAARGKLRREANKQHWSDKNKAWATLNVEYLAVKKKAHYQENVVEIKAKAKIWRGLNRHKKTASENHRRACQLNATPAWANNKTIQEFYYTANMLGMHTGDWYHVDHVIPLRSKLVCGLHVAANLQILPGVENISKGNRHWPDMPAVGGR